MERCFTADRDAGSYLFSLLEAAPATANAGHYARVVIEHAVRRRVVVAAVRLQDEAGVLSFDDLTSLALASWTDIVRDLDRVSPVARDLVR